MTDKRNNFRARIARNLTGRYRSYKQSRTDLDYENVHNNLQTILSRARYAFVITNTDSTQCCNARYVQPIIEWHGKTFRVWIGTLATSRKVAEISTNSNVTIAIGNDSAGANLIIQGKATLHTDEQLRCKYWNSVWRAFFPNGPRDPDYIVICVEPTKLELMSLRGNVAPEPFGLRPLMLELKLSLIHI